MKCHYRTDNIITETFQRLTTGVQNALFPVPAAGEHGADFPCCFDRHDLGSIRLAVVDARDGVTDETVAPPSDNDDGPEDVFDLCIAAPSTTHDDDGDTQTVLSLVMTS